MIIMSQRSSSSKTVANSNNKKNQQQRVTFASNDTDGDDDNDDDGSNIELHDDKDDDDDDDDDDDEDEDDEEEEDEEIAMNSSKPNRRKSGSIHKPNTDLELCPVPSFQLPSTLVNQTNHTNGANMNHTSNDPNRKELENHRYELWTLRIPSSVNIQDLNDTTLPIQRNVENFQTNTATKYQLHEGQAVENESFRLLTAANNNNTQDSAAEMVANNVLLPSSMSFQKHFNVVVVPSSSSSATTTKSTAQTLTLSPPPQQRHAYAPVPQKTGLKRRWLPFGTTVPTHQLQPSIDNCDISIIKHGPGTTITDALLMKNAPVVVKEEVHGVDGLDTPMKMELEDVPSTTKGESSKKKHKRNDDGHDEEHKNSDRKKKKEEKKAMKKERKQEKKKKNER